MSINKINFLLTDRNNYPDSYRDYAKSKIHEHQLEIYKFRE